MFELFASSQDNDHLLQESESKKFMRFSRALNKLYGLLDSEQLGHARGHALVQIMQEVRREIYSNILYTLPELL
jgi:hypothetical protein